MHVIVRFKNNFVRISLVYDTFTSLAYYEGFYGVPTEPGLNDFRKGLFSVIYVIRPITCFLGKYQTYF